MKIDSIIMLEGKRYRVTCMSADGRYLGCELVSNPKLKRTVDTLTEDVKVLYAFPIRSFAMLKYVSSNSIPMKLRFRFLQATPVVPEPIKGSRIV